MNPGLYFVPILAKAVAQPNTKKSLEEAFTEIQRLRYRKNYAEGFHNFCRFMSESYRRRQLLNEQVIRTAILQWADGKGPQVYDWEEPVPMEKDQLLSFRREYETLRQEFSRSTRETRAPIVLVLCEGRELMHVRFPKRPTRQNVDGIAPGYYTLKLDCGLVLWEGKFHSRDLIWTQAYRGKNLKLAAETSDIRRQPVREIRIPEAAVILRTFAGVETGSLEIELTV